MTEIKYVCVKCGRKQEPRVLNFCPYCNDEVFGRKTGDSVIIGLVLDDEED